MASEDDLAGDLKDIIVKAVPGLDVESFKKLMIALSIYVVNRDQKIMDHAYKLGKETSHGTEDRANN